MATKRSLAFVVFLALGTGTAAAQTAVWQGGTGNWEALTWNVNGTPNSDFQTIGGNAPANFAIDLNAIGAGNTLTRDAVGEGGQLVLNGGSLVQNTGTLNVQEDNNGTSAINIGSGTNAATVTLSGTAQWLLNTTQLTNTARGLGGDEGVLNLQGSAKITTLPGNRVELQDGFTLNMSGTSTIDTGFVRFDTDSAQNSFFNFTSGTITARSDNPVRATNQGGRATGVSNRINFVGPTGSALFDHVGVASVGNSMTDKITAGFFAINGVLVRDIGTTFVNGQGFQLTSGTQLTTIAQPANTFMWSLGADGEWTTAANWNNGVGAAPNSASAGIVFNGGFADADGENPIVTVASSRSAGTIALSHTNVTLAPNAGQTLTIAGQISRVATDAAAAARTVTFGGAGNVNASGGIANQNIAVIKTGTGTTTLNNAIHSGATTVEQGTLTITGDELRGPITVNSGATLNVSSFGTYTVPLEAPKQSFSGAGTIQGNLAVFDDALFNPGDAGVGTMTITGSFNVTGFNANSTNPTYPAGRWTFEVGNDKDIIGGTESDRIQVNGTFSTGGSFDATDGLAFNIVPVEGSLESGGTGYRLISYTGAATSLTGIRALITNDDGDILTTRQTVALSSAANQVNAVVSGAASTLVWKGGDPTNPTFWDLNTTANWNTGSVDKFFDLDNVTFDDTASTFNVQLQGSLNPGSITFNNSANNYVFTGATPLATIDGTTGITKNGTGTVDLNLDSLSYTGATNVNAGTLRLSGRTADPNPNPTAVNYAANLSGDFNIASGATLQLSGRFGRSTGNYNIASGGTLSYSNNAFANPSAVADDELVVWDNDGSIVYDLGGAENFNGRITGTGSMTVTSGIARLRNSQNDFSGGITVNGGSLEVDTRAVDPSAAIGTGTVVVNTGGEFLAVDETHTINNTITVNGGQIRASGTASTFTLGGTVNGSTINLRSDANSLLRVSGNVTGAGSVNKVGTGTLALVGSGNISAANVNGSEGVIDTTAAGGWTLGSGQTFTVGGTGFSGTSSLVGYWKFDTDGNDSAPGRDNDATFGALASVSTAQSVAGGGSVFFNNPTPETTESNDASRVTLPTGGPQGAAARTYSLWVRGTDNLGGDPGVFEGTEANSTFLSAGTNATGQRFDIKTAGTRDFRIEIQGSGQTYTTSGNPAGPTLTPGALYDNNWHHMAVVVESGTLAGVKAYIDGVRLTDSAATNAINTVGTNIFLGDSQNAGADRNFNGYIDEVQIYDIALNQTQVTQLFTTPGADLGLPIAFQNKSFNVVGDITFGAGSTLDLEISTTAVDKLIVDGEFTAGGTLKVSQFGAGTLALGNTFDILDATTVSGSFSSLMLPTLGSGLGWDFDLASGILEVVAATALAGDFNGDGTVNAADYTVYRDNLGGSETAFFAGTGSGNGTVGIEDYNLWRANFGATGGPGALGGAGSVPEPSTMALLALVGIGLAAANRRR